MDKYFRDGYEAAKTRLRYNELGATDLLELIYIYLCKYEESKDTYALGQCKAITEILAESFGIVVQDGRLAA